MLLYLPIAGVDFVELSVEESFSPSETVRYILIPIINDDIQEEMEQFTVQLSLPSDSTGVVLAQGSTTVQIVDEDREYLLVGCIVSTSYFVYVSPLQESASNGMLLHTQSVRAMVQCSLCCSKRDQQ